MNLSQLNSYFDAFRKNPFKVLASLFVVAMLSLLVMYLRGFFGELGKQHAGTEPTTSSGETWVSTLDSGDKAVRVLITNLVTTNGNLEEQFNTTDIIRILEDRIRPIGYLDSLDLVFIDRSISTESEVMRYFSDVADNSMIIYGNSRVVADTALFDIRFYTKKSFAPEFYSGPVLIRVELNNLDLMSRVYSKVSCDILERLNAFYYLSKTMDEDSENAIGLIRRIMEFYDGSSPCTLARSEKLAYMLDMCSAFNVLSQIDSLIKYATLSFDLDPGDARTYPWKASALFNTHRQSRDSLFYCVRLLRAAPKNSEIYSDKFLGKVFSEVAQNFLNTGEIDSVIHYCDSAITYDSTYYMPFFLKGVASLYECSVPKARRFFGEAYKNDSTLFETVYFDGIVNTLSGEFERGRKQFARAAQMEIRKFILEYKRHVAFIERCELQYQDSVKFFTSNLKL